MAGIGFELKRVVEQGGVGSFLKAALSGTMIVAGPWLISILSITIIQRLVWFLPPVDHQVFIAVIVYSYALSLILFGGIHYIFTRLLADLIYKKKDRAAGSMLVYFLLLTALAAGIIGGILGFFAGRHMVQQYFLIISVAVFFISVNLIWFSMMFI
jgi:uncharacterized membrane protein